jgi:prepilin-type N-terminal cleavage/methylation domain-containing protein
MQPFNLSRSRPRLRSGMTLMEVVLALAVFSLAAMALVGTLNQIAEAGIDSRRMLEVDQALESLIDEYGKMPQVRELDEQIKPGADGVAYRVLITQVKDLKNQDGRFLQNTFRIQAFARWNEGYGPIEVQAETLRYAGAYLPTNL